MTQEKEYVLGNKLVFSYAGEIDLIQDARFESRLNNSFGITEEQYSLVEALAKGAVEIKESAIDVQSTDVSTNASFYCLPAMRPSGNMEGRQFILFYAVIPTDGKWRLRRIFVRTCADDASDHDLLYTMPRPKNAMAKIRELLSLANSIEERVRRKRAPTDRKPNRPKAGPRTDQRNNQRQDWNPADAPLPEGKAHRNRGNNKRNFDRSSHDSDFRQPRNQKQMKNQPFLSLREQMEA